MTRPDLPDLPELLERAVPEPPPLHGLAARAEADARRSRARRRTAVGAGVLVVVAVVASLAIGSQPPPPVADDRAPNPAADVPCQAGVPTRETSDGAEPVSVRFCPVEDRQQFRAALVPDVALTSEVPATVAALDDAVRTAATAFCPAKRNPYRIQVALADGTVQDLSTQDCSNGYPILLGAIGRQEAPALDLDVPPLRCTGQLRDRALALPDVPPDVLSVPAVNALECARQGGVTATTEVDDPEGLRADLLSSYLAGSVDCEPNPGGTLTTWLLRLADGSLHAAVVNGRACSPLTIDDVYVGLAGPLLASRASGPD